MHFIRLTNVNYRGEQSPCYVNMELVTNITSYLRKYTIQPGGPGNPIGQIDVTVTCLSFAAGLSEEVDSILVIETPEQLMGLISENL